MSAPTVHRSRYGSNTRAWYRFTARHSADESSSSVSSKNARLIDGYRIVKSMPSSSRRSYSRPGRCAVARSRASWVGQPHHDGIARHWSRTDGSARSARFDAVSVGAVRPARNRSRRTAPPNSSRDASSSSWRIGPISRMVDEIPDPCGLRHRRRHRRPPLVWTGPRRAHSTASPLAAPRARHPSGGDDPRSGAAGAGAGPNAPWGVTDPDTARPRGAPRRGSRPRCDGPRRVEPSWLASLGDRATAARGR